MPMERPFSESDWLATPEPVRRYVEALEQRIEKLEESQAQLLKRVEQLEQRLNQNHLFTTDFTDITDKITDFII